jgi:hypothetical protein
MDSELVKWNAEGLIPGPGESREAYQKRVEYCLNLKKILLEELKPKDALQLNQTREGSLLEEATARILPIYGFSASWVPLFFSNDRLMPWQGAATWIFQCEADDPVGAFIQMRKSFWSKDRYLGLYDRGELLAHELCHVGRMAFSEPKYEELLAYSISQRSLTKSLGAIVQSAQESHFFLALLLAIIALDALFLYYGAFQAYLDAMWLKLLPLGFIFWGLWRLKKRQKTLQNALEKLSLLFNENAQAVLYRLTDAEIDLFAKSDPLQIEEYVRKQDSLRWEAIRLAYPQRLQWDS